MRVHNARSGELLSQRRSDAGLTIPVSTDQRDDIVEVQAIQADVALRITTFDGDDTVQLVDLGSVVVNTGRGHDRLQFSGTQDLDLTTLAGSSLFALEEIDVRGAALELALDGQAIRRLSSFATLLIRHDHGSTLDLIGEWYVDSLVFVDGQWRHQLRQSAGLLQVASPSLWQNPIDALDADRSGRVTSLDALMIINELNRNPSGRLETPAAGDLTYRYLDTNGNLKVTAIDALQVINGLNVSSNQSEGEELLFHVATIRDELADSLHDPSRRARSQLAPLPHSQRSMTTDRVFASEQWTLDPDRVFRLIGNGSIAVIDSDATSSRNTLHLLSEQVLLGPPGSQETQRSKL
ncbi:MAG: dockerin type I domain-containing protein [Rubripirellula sp.]